jgi:hypothetical protein
MDDTGKINSVKETKAQGSKYKRPTSKEKSQKKRQAKDVNGNIFDIDIEGQF